MQGKSRVMAAVAAGALTVALGAGAAGVVAVPSMQWEISPWLLLGIPVAVAVAVRRGASTVDAWRRGQPVAGVFTFSPPPPGVVDRFRA